MEQDLPSAKATSQHFMNGCLKNEKDRTFTLQSDFTPSEIQVKVEPDHDSSLLGVNGLTIFPHPQEDVKEEFLDTGLQIFPTGLIPPVEMEEEPEIPTSTSPDKHLEKRADSSRKRKTCTNKQSVVRKRKETNASNHSKRCSTEQSKATEQILPTEINSDMSSEEIKCCVMHGNRTLNPKKTAKGRTSNKQHREEPFSCETCGKQFQRSDLLTDHMKIHRRQKPYACDQCELKFAKPSYLKIHLRRHAGDRPVQCDQCEKRFFDLYDLKVHQRDHTGERPFVCSECGKGFKRIYILNKHKRTHSQERPFQCSVCGKAYRYGYSYRLHMKDHLN